MDRVYEQLSGNKHYNDEREKQAVLTSIKLRARCSRTGAEDRRHQFP